MLKRFLKSFELDDTNGRSLKSLPSDAAITKSLEGLSFNDGLYRVHSQLDLSKWNEIITRVFNQYVGRISCFGYDWLGRQFAIDHADREGKKLQVLMFEVGRGKVYQIPANIVGFHDDILVDMAEPSLERSLYSAWRNAGNAAPNASQCAGYKVPPIVGGRDEIDNLLLIDMEVEWHITGELLEALAKVPKGSRIDKVTTASQSEAP